MWDASFDRDDGIVGRPALDLVDDAGVGSTWHVLGGPSRSAAGRPCGPPHASGWTARSETPASASRTTCLTADSTVLYQAGSDATVILESPPRPALSRRVRYPRMSFMSPIDPRRGSSMALVHRLAHAGVKDAAALAARAPSVVSMLALRIANSAIRCPSWGLPSSCADRLPASNRSGALRGRRRACSERTRLAATSSRPWMRCWPTPDRVTTVRLR
jgi:hypothetical protein